MATGMQGNPVTCPMCGTCLGWYVVPPVQVMCLSCLAWGGPSQEDVRAAPEVGAERVYEVRWLHPPCGCTSPVVEVRQVHIEEPSRADVIACRTCRSWWYRAAPGQVFGGQVRQ